MKTRHRQVLVSVALAICALGRAPSARGETEPKQQQDKTGSVRTPAVQGQFYPADRKRLAAVVDRCLADRGAKNVNGTVKALILPHAGYVYSGAVAGRGVAQIDETVKRVIVLAPSHHVRFQGGSVPGASAYRNALGDVPVDDAAEGMVKKLACLRHLDRAHQREHSLEVMLPFLQRKLASFTLVPIVLGGGFDIGPLVKELADLTRDRHTLLIASTDLSHYHAYDQAEKKDNRCIQRILELDTKALQKEELCGKIPVSILVEVAKRRAWQPVLIDYGNSGDTAGGRDRVVGYAAIAFVTNASNIDKPRGETGATPSADPAAPASQATGTPNPKDDSRELLQPAERKLLLQLARKTLTATLADTSVPPLPEENGIFKQPLGCFVTLHKNGRLRGCIGNILPRLPLAEAVRKNAVKAALHDPRFPAVKASELEDIELEISVLSRPRKLTCTGKDDLLDRLRPGVDGVLLLQPPHSATYLPQVWKQLPDKKQFLSRLCHKAGLPNNAWQDTEQTQIYVYQAVVFDEKTLARDSKEQAERGGQ